jgi:hypothetical protein
VSRGKQRSDPRKYRRIPVRYGSPEPRHKAFAMQISTRGFFLSTNEFVYARDSPIIVEITGPAETWLVTGIVRHAVKVHPTLARFAKPGMGVEMTQAPPACREYLASL